MRRIGDALRMLRESRGLNQQQMADALHIHVASYSRWEGGQVEIRLSDLPTIKTALGIEDWGTLFDALGMAPTAAYQPAAEFVAQQRMARLPGVDEESAARKRRNAGRSAFQSRGHLPTGANSAENVGADSERHPPSIDARGDEQGPLAPRNPSPRHAHRAHGLVGAGRAA